MWKIILRFTGFDWVLEELIIGRKPKVDGGYYELNVGKGEDLVYLIKVFINGG
jgi:hypothetical protein